MTAQQTAQEWQRGAERALKAAQDLCNTENYEVALFTCHLAVEKALKAYYVYTHDTDPPKIHNLEELCTLIGIESSEEELKQLNELTTFSAFARYGDDSWVDAEATAENCKHWLDVTKTFLKKLSV